MSKLIDFTLTSLGITDVIALNPGGTLNDLNVDLQSAAMGAGFFSAIKPIKGIASGASIRSGCQLNIGSFEPEQASSAAG